MLCEKKNADTNWLADVAASLLQKYVFGWAKFWH